MKSPQILHLSSSSSSFPERQVFSQAVWSRWNHVNGGVTSRDWWSDVTWLAAWRHVTPEQDILYHIITSPSIWWGGVTLTLTLLYTACVWCRVLYCITLGTTFHYTALHCFLYWFTVYCTTLCSEMHFTSLHYTVHEILLSGIIVQTWSLGFQILGQ